MEHNGDNNPFPSREGHSDWPSMRNGELDVARSGEEEAAATQTNEPAQDGRNSEHYLCEERKYNCDHIGLTVRHTQNTPVPIKEEPHFHETDFTGSLTELARVQVKEEPDLHEYEPSAHGRGQPSPNMNTVKEEFSVKEEPLEEAQPTDAGNLSVPDDPTTLHSVNQVLQEKFNCSKCQKPCFSEADLLAHQESHQGPNDIKMPVETSALPDQPEASDMFICTYSGCQRLFLNKAGLNTHIWRFHQKGTSNSNPSAGRAGPNKKLAEHSSPAAEKPTDTFSCSDSGCKKLFPNKDELDRHQESHQSKKVCLEPPTADSSSQQTSGEVFRCMYCGVSYNDPAHLNAHMRSHPEERPYPCDSCSRTFSRRSELINHLVTHVKRKPYSCSLCGKRFTTQSGVVGHSRIHIGEKRFSCPECGKCFKDQSELHAHKEFHITEQPFECLDCGRRFHKQSFLVTHQRCHQKEAQLFCQECGKSFISSTTLEEHLKTHIPDEKYACTACGEWFPNKASLETHWKSHIKERPYACTACGKRYVLPSQLRKHRRTHASLHTDDKAHSCSECGKCFDVKSDLDAHQKSHQGKKPYRCSDCGKGFALKHSFMRHLATHIVQVTIS